MKLNSKILFCCLLGIAMLIGADANAQSKNENYYIGRGRSVEGVAQLLASYSKNFTVSASVDVYPSSYTTGMITHVNYIIRPEYNEGPEAGHAPAMPIIIASVIFDSEDKIIGWNIY